MSSKVLLTGASGFIGRRVAPLLAQQSELIAVHRRVPLAAACGRFAMLDRGIDATTEWEPWLRGVSIVVHLAALAHVTVAESLDAFRKINTFGTLHLAKAAAGAGVRRFVFLSSIGVNGASSVEPFNPMSPTQPEGAYAVAKLEAERGLRELSKRTGMEIVIVRAPLVYGPECTGNLLRLLRLISRGIPLPLGCVRNLRSVVGVHNLAEFLSVCVWHPRAAGQTFLIADTPDISTPDLIRKLADGMNRPARIVPFPYALLREVARLTGNLKVLEKICGTLQVDSSLAAESLGWYQRLSLDEGIKEVGRWYASQQA